MVRFFADKRLRSYRKRFDVRAASERWVLGFRSFIRFLGKMTPTDAERILKAFLHDTEGFIEDPIDHEPEYADTMAAVELQLKQEFTTRRLGLCHRVWARKKKLLANQGMNWYSPSELNPGARFD